jgi:hypothetical protein
MGALTPKQGTLGCRQSMHHSKTTLAYYAGLSGYLQLATHKLCPQPSTPSTMLLLPFCVEPVVRGVSL